MNTKGVRLLQNQVMRLRRLPVSGVLALLSVAGLTGLLLLARHSSTEPTVLGRWSPRYAYLLAFVATSTLVLALFSVPSWRARILRRPSRPVTRRLAWTLVAVGLTLLPVLHLLLRGPDADRDRTLALFAGLSLAAVAALVLLLLWRSGAAAQTLPLRRPWLLLLLLFGVQLLLIAEFPGRVPQVYLVDESEHIANALRQFRFPDRFILLPPERNAATWLDFSAYWVPAGAWLSVFGAGIAQARFFNLLVAWLALPFLYLTASKLQGRAAALIATALGIALPLHFVTSRSDVWVATAIAIALCCFVLARDPAARRPRLLRLLCGFFALSSIDGHPYGIAFAFMFGLLQLAELLRALRAGEHRRQGQAFAGFVAGAACYALFWLGYHIALPGVHLDALPDLLQKTWSLEADIGARQHGIGLTAGNLLSLVQNIVFFQPFALLLATFAALVTVFRSRASLAPLVMLPAGSFFLVILTLAHTNAHYSIFWLPFLCLLPGSWLAGFLQPSSPSEPTRESRLSFGATYVLLALWLLSVLWFGDLVYVQADHHANSMATIKAGQEIDHMLPDEDIVVAGTPELYLGMPQRLNFGGSCGYTWEQENSWPLDAPQAIIYTPGWDKGCDRLPGWLIDHDLQPARCFAVPGLGDGVAILYLLPELMPEEIAIDCAPEDLAWPQRAT